MQHYTTNEVSQLTGIPAGTIRSWLTRKVGSFEIDHHIIIDGTGRKLWTDEGIALLKAMAGHDPMTDDQQTDDELVLNPEDFIEDLLDSRAQELAIAFWQQLPIRTLEHIRRMGTRPTRQERELVGAAVKHALGIGISHLLAPSQEENQP